jgi:hypothetical protein
MNITNIITNSIERIRGGDIIVQVTCTFEDGSSFSGFSTTNLDTEESIRATRVKAVTDCISLKESYLNSSNAGLSVVLKEVATPQYKKHIDGKLEKGDISDSDYKELLGMANEKQEEDLNGLCECLGIGRIKVQDNYTMMEAAAVIALLSSLTKRLESKVN